MITYSDSLSGVSADMLAGFFAGWRHRPSRETRLRMLGGSDHVVLAMEEGKGCRRVVGFINALTDGSHFAFIPLLEVHPDHRNRGVGTELLRRMLHALQGYPCIDLTCDAELQSFYERCGMQRSVGMVVRDYSRRGDVDS